MAVLILHDPDGWAPGEREVAEVLQRELPDSWLLVAHLVIPDRDDDRELDLVVVGDGFVHNVEVKSSGGRISIDASYMRSGGGVARTSPLRQAGTAAKVLRGVLERRVDGFKGLTGRPVTSRVAFSNPDARLQHVDDGVRRRVSTLTTVADDLLRKDKESGQIAPLRPQLQEYFSGAKLRDPMPTDLHGFRVIERLESRRSCLTFRCEHFADNSMWIVRLLQPKPTLNREAASRESEALLTEYRALAGLAPLGVAPRVELPQRLDSDQVLVAIAEPDGRSLLDLIEEGQRPDEPEVRRVVHEAFRSLAVVHEQGHLHRALTPERVVIRPDGGVLVTDFSVAHVDGHTGLSSVLADLDPDDDHERYWRAPETRLSILGAVEASDVYALATTLKAWVIGSIKSSDLKKDTLNRHGEARQRLGSAHDDFVDLLKGCRAERYAERATAAEVADRWASPAAVDDVLPPGPVVPICHRELLPGERIDERFVVRRQLGSGATAVTVLAYDEQSEREVVLKGLDFDRVPEELAKQEFEALLGLNHDRIAVVRDRYRSEHPYHLVIDYAPGAPAADRLGDFVGDAESVGSIAHALLDGLAYLHSRGVLHRDISAANIVLGDADPSQLKIIDFGLASLEAQVTGSVGTPRYRAPEIEAGGEWTPACDTYSAAVLLYQLLTGELPYAVRNGLAKAEPAEAPTTLPPEARRLAELLLGGTAFDPADRFGDGVEFLGALVGWLRSEAAGREPSSAFSKADDTPEGSPPDPSDAAPSDGRPIVSEALPAEPADRQASADGENELEAVLPAEDEQLDDQTPEGLSSTDFQELLRRVQQLTSDLVGKEKPRLGVEPAEAGDTLGREPQEPAPRPRPARERSPGGTSAAKRNLEVVEVPLLANGKLYAKTVNKLRRLSGHDGSGRTVRYWKPYMEDAGYRIVAEGRSGSASGRARAIPATQVAHDQGLEPVEVPLDPSGKLYVKTVGRLRRLTGHESKARTVGYWQPHMRHAGYRLVVRR